MPTIDVLVPFAAASLLLALLPGPNVVFLLSKAAQYGGWVAWRSAIGVETATLVLGIASALGVGTLIAASALAFQVLKWAGVAYLCWLGWQTLRQPSRDDESTTSLAKTSFRPRRREALQGFIVGLTNPKVTLFLVAFLPQFVRSDSAMSQMLVLSVVFAGVGLACDILWCVVGDTVRRLLPRLRLRIWLDRVPAAAYFGLAGWAATAGHSQQ